MLAHAKPFLEKNLSPKVSLATVMTAFRVHERLFLKIEEDRE